MPCEPRTIRDVRSPKQSRIDPATRLVRETGPLIMNMPMNYLRETNRRTERSGAADDNIVTLRADRNRIAAIDHDDAIDAAVSFVLNVLFDSNRSKAEIRIARAMFRPSASIVLIPRERPSLACAIGIDEFFAAEKDMLNYETGWEESWRIHDPVPDASTRLRVRSHIVLDPGRDIPKPRSTEVVFALRNASNAQRIQSCTIVYDESPRTSSPVTLFA
jgi:hypothetical protein